MASWKTHSVSGSRGDERKARGAQRLRVNVPDRASARPDLYRTLHRTHFLIRDPPDTMERDAAKLAVLESCYSKILDTVESDMKRDRQGLIKTPERAGKAMLHFTKGYQQTLEGKQD